MLLTSIFIIILGFLLKFWPPKHINSSIGYKTPFAMKNQETWNEGNKFAAIMLILSGILSLSVSLLIIFIYKETEINTARYLGIFAVFIICTVLLGTEIHLRKLFDRNGSRKQ